jgi:ABC-2 type transport system ATP-binding protein
LKPKRSSSKGDESIERANIESIHRDGKSILISSHILQDMDEICTNIAILEKGKLVYSRELEGSFVIRTEPIPLSTYTGLAEKYCLTGNDDRTILHVKTDPSGVSELVKALAACGVSIFEVSSANVKSIVHEQLHILDSEQ